MSELLALAAIGGLILICALAIWGTVMLLE